jgi:hypothetical protein
MILKLMAETKGHSHILGTLAPVAFRLSAKILHRSVPWWRLLSSESALSVFCYRATNVFGKGGSKKRVRSVRDGPGDAMIRRIITRFSAGL